MHLAAYRATRSFGPVLLVMMATAAATAAQAQDQTVPSAQDADPAAVGDTASERAQALFDEALELVGQRRFGEACAKFAESVALEARSGSSYNLAHCYEVTGKLASAWASYQSAAELAVVEGELERVDLARKAADALAPKLSKLTLVVDRQQAPAGLGLWIDEVEVEPAQWGEAQPLDPGEHVIEARAPQCSPWHTTITVRAEAESTVLHVPALQPIAAATAPVATVAPPAPPPARPTAPPVAPPPEPSAAGPALLWAGLGLGAAGIAVGGITGAITLSRASSLRDACGEDGWCHPDLQADYEMTEDLATASNIAFAVGGVGLATAIVALIFLDEEPTSIGGRTGPAFAFGATPFATVAHW